MTVDLQSRLDACLDVLWAIAHLQLGEVDEGPKLAWAAFKAENTASHGAAFAKRATLVDYLPAPDI